MSTRSFSFIDGNPLSTEAILVNASSSHYGEDWSSIRHTHPFTELFYVCDGNGEFFIEDQVFSIAKDDLIIVNPYIQHTEKSQPDTPLSYYTVGVDGISFSFHDKREFRIFNCREKRQIFCFIFILYFGNWKKKKRAMKKYANIILQFSLPSFAELLYLDSSWFLLFIQARSALWSGAIWILITVRISRWISLPVSVI